MNDLKVENINGDHIGTIIYLEEIKKHVFVPRHDKQIYMDAAFMLDIVLKMGERDDIVNIEMN